METLPLPASLEAKETTPSFFAEETHDFSEHTEGRSLFLMAFEARSEGGKGGSISPPCLSLKQLVQRFMEASEIPKTALLLLQ